MVPAPPVDLEVALVEYVSEACGKADVEVHDVHVDLSHLGKLSSVEWAGDPCQREPTLRLSAFRRGQIVAQVTVKPDLTIWLDAPVASEAAAVGDTVRVVMGRIPLYASFGTPVSLGDWMATMPLKAGEPVTRWAVVPLPQNAVASR